MTAVAIAEPSSRIARLSPWGRDWARALKRRGHSPRTVEEYLRCVLQFEDHLLRMGALKGDDSPRVPDGALELDGWHVDPKRWSYSRLVEYLDTFEGRNPRTINAQFSAVSHYLKHVSRHHKLPQLDLDRFWEEELHIYTSQIRKLNARRVNTPPSHEVLSRCLQHEPHLRNRALLLLAAKTGARKSELLSLDWDDIDLIEGIVRFKTDRRHYKRTNFIGLIDAETVVVLRLWRAQCAHTENTGNKAVFIGVSAKSAGERLGRQAAFKIVTEAFERVGERAHNVHSLRHWFTDTLRTHGMPDYMIAYLRGDAPASTLDLYTHLQSESGIRHLRLAYDGAMPNLLA